MIKKVRLTSSVITIGFWLTKAKNEIDSLDAELILLHALRSKIKHDNDIQINLVHDACEVPQITDERIDRSYLVAHNDEILPRSCEKYANAMLSARKDCVPLAYLLGTKEFYGRDFEVNKDVLIPRPESETIIRFALEIANQWDKESRIKHTILDVGTGSGCLAVTLALEIPEVEVSACDISQLALNVAKKNARRYDADINFFESSLLGNYDAIAPEILVANLPYVSRDWEWTSPEIGFEPALALYADNNGLALIYQLIDQIELRWDSNKKTRYLILEADTLQHKKIMSYAEKHGLKFVKKDNFVLEFMY